MVADENPARMPTYKMLRKKHSPAKQVMHPAPWQYSSVRPKQGIKHIPAVMMESDRQVYYTALGKEQTLYYTPNMGERGVRRGYPSAGPPQKQVGVRYLRHANQCTEEVVRAPPARRVRPLDNIGNLAYDPVPFKGLELSPSGRARGRSHSPAYMQNSFTVTHSQTLQPKPLRRAGEAISNEAKVNALLERRTLSRRPCSAEARSCPFGTSYDWEPNLSRRPCVHHDTRTLLSHAY